MDKIESISKEAGVLRMLLKSGKIDLNHLQSFLAKVEGLNNTPPKGRNKAKESFDRQLDRLNKKGFSKRRP
jgi:hypothetical protein